MRLGGGRAAAWARLLAWDAGFLPEVRLAGDGRGTEVEVVAPAGVPLAATARWPLGDRTAVALQLVAAVAFLHERGWYPSRRLVRGARVARGTAGVRLRLGQLPEASLEEGAARRVGARGSDGGDLVGRLLRPLLRELVPELHDALAATTARRPAWEAAAALAGALVGGAGRARALRHPEGVGRSLWACRWQVPRTGAGWVARDEDAFRIAAAVALTAVSEGRDAAVRVGEVEEEELLRHLSRSAADHRDGVVVTTLSSAAAAPVLLDEQEQAVWVLGADLATAAGWAAAAAGGAGGHPARAAAILTAGAARGFAGRVTIPADDLTAARMVSPAARKCLEVLRCSPVGFAANELARLLPDAEAAFAELLRAGLAGRKAGVRVALGATDVATAGFLELARRLEPTSPRRLLAEALAGDVAPLVAWCDGLLDVGRPVEVLQIARAAATVPEVACRCAEAALLRGLGLEAGKILDGVPRQHRDAAWRAVAAWRRDVVGASPDIAGVAGLGTDGLPGRLACRVELVRARAARLRGDATGEREALQRAVAAGGASVPQAKILLASLDGPEGVRRLHRQRCGGWEGDARAALLHEMAYRRYSAGAWTAAATGFRAALRCATGSDLDLLGRIHVDLAGAAILRDQPVAAERHLLLAERIFERCGSQRSVTLAKKNRAALACDRLDWRLATRLLDEAGSGEAVVPGLPAWLDELERIHIALARGRCDDVRRRLPVVEARLQPVMDQALYSSAVAGVGGHLALADGDLKSAREHARAAEAGDRRLFDAVLDAASGVRPPALPSNRWGMATTARVLAAWRDEGPQRAAEQFARERVRDPLAAAVGLARLVAILSAAGERLGDGWSDVCSEAVGLLSREGLDGWAERLTGATAGGAVDVVRALDRVVNAGTDALNPERLAAVARAVGLAGLQVWLRGELAAGWGDDRGESRDVEAADVRLRAFGVGGAAADAVCLLLARNLAGRPERSAAPPPTGTSLIGRSRGLEKVREMIARWAPLPAPVLILGEPGTGKELVARELHRLSGRRGPLVPVNCAGIPDALLEAELFGAVRGAYTGADRDRMGLVEAAEGGTLLLDEIGELPLAVQAKLLRLLQEREVRRVGATRSRMVDVRFVAATNQDLVAAQAAGRFRSDLYYRLELAVVEVPPLRDRLDDVEDLAPLFVSRAAAEYARPGVSLAAEAIRPLQGYHWPGNVRELEQAVRRAVAAAEPGEALGPDRFAFLGERGGGGDGPGSWAAAQQALRREYFTGLLEACGGNRSEAARRAGISRQSLLYHLRALGLQGGREE